ncbi:IlvD/Edd family dehydratase [Marinobacter nanhaiticus D15-8W]|uniref:Dihydroxy-acid dehydratase n=1 Tax=Marinobacter nanhaiticus D15-8W TaxID=626887 RepID=N6X129_9GAMM|nr:IlvD/Edd family dehydratase [Marinobacter nanhaiticus]ENO14768.1 dihydroxy-acid dehydratase [Marinobacter nanhaiticus D15-8W]BES69543.1 IlvD/Edd family dehydratase [Marinobacter nanhaiticus D15-8W]
MSSNKDRKLRSQQWYGKLDRDGFIHRSWMKSQGFPDHAFDGRPVIGICNTWSEITPCNSHLRDIAEFVKRGVWEAGGVPLEFPAMSLGETQMRPTAMLFRNLLSMEVEESIRANPLDGVVLLGGCDKTTPGQVMGAASVNLPTAVISSGPMLNGKYRGRDIGSGTDVWKFSEQVRAGTMSLPEFLNAESCMSRSVGTCMTMGTASTMASLMEAMGLALPLNGTLPAVDSRRRVLAHLTGRRLVEMVHEDLTISKVLTREAFENAIKVNAAIGGSTNAVVHLLAMAGRLGVDLTLEDFDRLGREIPLLVNLMPSGKYLMEDFHYNGGVPVVLKRLSDQLHLDAPSISGGAIGEALDEVECFDDDVIRPMDNPVRPAAGIAVLKGNLCPNGAIIKPSAASEPLLKHRGKAVVFETIEDFKARVDAPDLDVDENSILVLKGCGPKGYPGMPEVGNMPLPRKLLEKGITDMVRLSDARMSGTAFGTVVLHISPEANEGGPLALVRNGDWIELDVEARQLHLDIPPDELIKRQTEWEAPETPHARGYYRLYIDHVLQADQGADLDFLVGGSGHVVTRESH